jgi:hypothetical protein
MKHCRLVNGCAGSHGSVLVSKAAHVLRTEKSWVEVIVLETCCIHAKFSLKTLVKKPLLRQKSQLCAAGIHAIMLRVKDGNGESNVQMHVRTIRHGGFDLISKISDNGGWLLQTVRKPWYMLNCRMGLPHEPERVRSWVNQRWNLAM